MFCSILFQTYFVGKLSQRIRTMRNKDNPTKSSTGGEDECSSSSKRPRFFAAPVQATDTEEGITSKDLKEKWASGKSNKATIMSLMKATRQEREKFIEGLPDGQMAQIVSEYLCLEEGEYVSDIYIAVIR